MVSLTERGFEPPIYYAPDGRVGGPARDRLIPGPNQIEIGTSLYAFPESTQQLLQRSYSSNYPKDTSVVIIDEPHDSSEGQFNLF